MIEKYRVLVFLSSHRIKTPSSSIWMRDTAKQGSSSCSLLGMFACCLRDTQLLAENCENCCLTLTLASGLCEYHRPQPPNSSLFGFMKPSVARKFWKFGCLPYFLCSSKLSATFFEIWPLMWNMRPQKNTFVLFQTESRHNYFL